MFLLYFCPDDNVKFQNGSVTTERFCGMYHPGQNSMSENGEHELLVRYRLTV